MRILDRWYSISDRACSAAPDASSVIGRLRPAGKPLKLMPFRRRRA